MTKHHDCAVLVVGGGPVGMTLALELARLGVPSTLLEQSEQTTRYPKMDLTNVRSMELFRRLGLAERLRDVGVPRGESLRHHVDDLAHRARAASFSLPFGHGLRCRDSRTQ